MVIITEDLKKNGRIVLNYQNDKVISRYCQDNNVSKEDGILYFREMLKFLYACTVSEIPLTPSQALDEVWHTFILFTKDYSQFCKDYLGRFVHHNPDTDSSLQTKQKNRTQYGAAYELATQIYGELPNFMWHIPKQNLAVADCDASCGGCHGCDGDCFGCNSE